MQIVADNSLKLILFFLRKKDLTMQTIHMKCQALFSLKKSTSKFHPLQLQLVLNGPSLKQ